MSKQLKLRRGTTAQHSTFTGASGEVTVDTSKKTLVVHDGTTAGGAPLAKESQLTSSNISFQQSGTGATSRTVDVKLKEVVSVKDFGAVGDGTTDDTAAFNAALAASYAVFVPPSTSGYKLTSAITIPANTSLYGQNKRTTKILHSYNGNMFNMSDGASLRGLYLEGQGATYSGYGLYFAGTDGRQLVQNCKIINFDSACAYFEVAAGSQCVFIDVEAYRVSAGTGTSRCAFEIISTQQLSAVPRKFSHIETGGQCAFNFGGCNDTFVTNSFLGDLIYTNQSRGVLITSCRIANQTSLIVDGHNNAIIGCDIAPQITIAAGSSADNIAIQGNSYNVLPVIDNSGNGRNLVDYWSVTYTPVMTSGGTAPSLGNGTLTGVASRKGNTVTVNIALTLGSTTSLGTGDLRFSLPTFATSSIFSQWAGQAAMTRGGTYYTAPVQVVGAGNNWVRPIRDTSGPVTFNSPATWASGDTFTLSFTYII